MRCKSPLDPENACPVWMRITGMPVSSSNASGDNGCRDKYIAPKDAKRYGSRPVLYTIGNKTTRYESRAHLAVAIGVDVSAVGKAIKTGRTFRCGGTAVQLNWDPPSS